MVLPLSLAYCYNSLDGRWYSYDDSTVEPVMEEDISTRGAYILFYQRRNVVPSWPGGSSVRGLEGFLVPPLISYASIKFYDIY